MHASSDPAAPPSVGLPLANVEVLVEDAPGEVDVVLQRAELDIGIGEDQHDHSVSGELLDERAELLVLDLHTLDRCADLPTAELELLNNVADPLVLEQVARLLALAVRDDQVGLLLEEDDLAAVTDLAEFTHLGL